jgi:hypothetical protein
LHWHGPELRKSIRPQFVEMTVQKLKYVSAILILVFSHIAMADPHPVCTMNSNGVEDAATEIAIDLNPVADSLTVARHAANLVPENICDLLINSEQRTEALLLGSMNSISKLRGCSMSVANQNLFNNVLSKESDLIGQLQDWRSACQKGIAKVAIADLRSQVLARAMALFEVQDILWNQVSKGSEPSAEFHFAKWSQE